MAKRLEATSATWPEVHAAFGWAWRAAAILGNKKSRDAAGVRRRYRDLITALGRRRGSLGGLDATFDHFGKVTRSDWDGLFRCYGVAELPRTNNDLEQFFGSHLYHQRPVQGWWCVVR